jgi:hypothetical protein
VRFRQLGIDLEGLLERLKRLIVEVVVIQLLAALKMQQSLRMIARVPVGSCC